MLRLQRQRWKQRRWKHMTRLEERRRLLPQPSVSSIPLCLALMLKLRGLAQHDATAVPNYGISHVSRKFVSHSGSHQTQTPTDTEPSSPPGRRAMSRSRGRERRKNRGEKKYDDANSAVAIEAASLQAAENPKGLSIFKTILPLLPQPLRL